LPGIISASVTRKPPIAVNSAGAQPPYQTTNATAENVVASGNTGPITGVSATRDSTATAMLATATA